MSAELDRNAVRWVGRPQVGRFYGDFLCMGSFRENNNFASQYRGAPDLALKSRIKRWLAGPPPVSSRLKPLTNSGGR